MVEKRGYAWCVIHGHPQKTSSKTDKPKGTPIKCFPYIPGNKESENAARKKAYAMHQAIIESEKRRGK